VTQLLRLGALFTLIALATSRLILIVHELVGHGAVAEAVGGDVTRVKMFWFAGGFVEMSLPDGTTWLDRYLVFLGGVGLELVAGVIAVLVARRLRAGSVARLAVFAFGAINLVHALFYLAAGTHHGYGDGRILHAELGGARPVAVAVLSALVCAAAFFLARALIVQVRRRLPGSRRAALATVAGAVLIAGAVHAALAFGELAVRRDRTYAAVMQTESGRQVDRAVAVAQVQRPEIDPAELERLRRALAEEHRQFPVRTLLLIAVALAILLGAASARDPDGAAEPLTWRDLTGPALACGGAVGLVMLLSAIL
jgi:uncharacterized protein (DUF2267 family)